MSGKSLYRNHQFGDVTGDDSNDLFDLANLQDAPAQGGFGISPASASIADMLGGLAAAAVTSTLDYGNAFSGVPGGGADIRVIDMMSFAKGGNSGGGGSTGGGGGGAVTQYFSGSGNGDAGYDIW